MGYESAERRKANVLKMMCLRSFVGVPQMDRVMNEEVNREAEIEMKLVSRTDQRVFRGFGHMERINDNCIARKVFIEEVSGWWVWDKLRDRWYKL